jgi:hypothetical protein
MPSHWLLTVGSDNEPLWVRRYVHPFENHCAAMTVGEGSLSDPGAPTGWWLQVSSRGRRVAIPGGVRESADMSNPILYLARGEEFWLLTREMVDRYDVPAIPVCLASGQPLPRSIDIEVALKRAREIRPGYTIRVANWFFPKVDWLP